MRKISKQNFKSFFMWVIVFVLTLVVSMGGAYAYFTTTAEKRQASATTGIIKVGFSSDTKLIETGTGSSSNVKVVPGSTVSYNGQVQNTGTADMFALLECNVAVDDKIVQTQYYTATGVLMAYSDAQKTYTTGATPIAVGAQSQFSISFTFDTTYGNEYKNKTAKLQVVARAIQQSHLTAVQATNILLEGTGGGTVTLPTTYTQLAYITATGSQWFATDFAVDSSTDNFIVETAIKWTQSGTRQLMGYSGSSSSGYFGVRADMKYELAGNVSGNISASTTSFDSLKVIRNKTSNIWSMYVNNSLAGKSSIDAMSGKMTVGSLYQSETSYKCYCQIRYFKIYQDGALKYNLIPSQNSAGAVGMYDTINNKFYQSKTGTAFVAGAPAEPTQLLDSSLYTASATKTGLTFTSDKTTGYITINGTATAASYWNPSTQTNTLLVANHKYAMVGMAYDGQNTHWGLLNQNATGDYGSGAICTVDGSLGKSWGIVWQNGATYNNFKFKPCLYDLTELYGAGNEPANAFDLNKDYNRNLWTCDKKITYSSSEFAKYDGASQVFTITNSGSSETHGSQSVFTLPTALPANTTITMSVYCLSGTITAGTLTVGGYHNLNGTRSWQNFITLTNNVDLTGKVFTKTFTTTDTLTDFWLFVYHCKLENVKFKVQLEFGSVATEYQPYLAGLIK